MKKRLKRIIIVGSLATNFLFAMTNAFADDDKSTPDARKSKTTNTESKDDKDSGNAPEPTVKEILKRVKASAVIHADSSGSGGVVSDEKTQSLRCRISISNEYSFDLKGLAGYIYIIGKSVRGGRDFKILKIVKVQDIYVPKKEKYSSEPQICRTEYDNSNSYQYGHKYEGSLLILKDSSGEVVLKKGLPPKYERIADKIMELEENSIFDAKGSFIKRGCRYSD